MKNTIPAVLAILLLPAAAMAQSGPPGPAQSLTNDRVVVQPPRQGFTVGMRPGPNNEYGHPFVEWVVEGSNAERAGLLAGDTILSVNGRDTRTPPLFPVREAGTRYVLRVRRGQEELELLFVYPDPAARAAPADAGTSTPAPQRAGPPEAAP